MLQIMERNKRRVEKNTKKNNTYPIQYKNIFNNGERGEGFRKIHSSRISFFWKRVLGHCLIDRISVSQIQCLLGQKNRLFASFWNKKRYKKRNNKPLLFLFLLYKTIHNKYFLCTKLKRDLFLLAFYIRT